MISRAYFSVGSLRRPTPSLRRRRTELPSPHTICLNNKPLEQKYDTWEVWFFFPWRRLGWACLFSKGTQFISKKFKEEKCVFLSGKSAHTLLALLSKWMSLQQSAGLTALISSACSDRAYQETFFQIHTWGFEHSYWHHFNLIWLYRKKSPTQSYAFSYIR